MAGPTNLRLLTDFFNKIGHSRHFVATLDEGRFRTEADMNRQARPSASVANDPKATFGLRRPKAGGVPISHS
jgi:hypothetical protein